MFATIINVLVWGCMVIALVSCNIYAPFDSKSDSNDYIEAAQKCLHDNDYACAVENYNSLPAGELKSQRLCVVYLAKAGFTINALIGTVKTNSATMLGTLAEALVPWDATKSADVNEATVNCAAYAAFPGSGQTGVLLKNVAYLVDCATQLAKTDVLLGSSAADTTCTTASTSGDGLIRQADINAGGVGATMCLTDAVRCTTDFAAMDTASLGSSLNDVKAAITATNGAGGISSAVGAAASRTALSAAVTP